MHQIFLRSNIELFSHNYFKLLILIKMMPLIKQFKHLQIHLDAIISATSNFADENCIGRGGFGNVYKGELVHSKGRTTVALKRLNRAFGQGDPEFWKEIIMLSIYRHENIVSLLGFCDDRGEKILVYEYASKRSLDLYLTSNELTWVRRLKICIGAARGVSYLHNSVGGKQQRVLHRDIKSSNILLDENWNARISDLGLSKFGPANQQYTFLVSHAVGTVGYCDPLYIETGLLTKESDVYSFGVVLFEVLCGRLCIDNKNDKRQSLTRLVRLYYEENKIDKIIYDNIKHEIDPNSLKAFTTIAYQCLNSDREARPLMTEVVRVLETALGYQLSITKEIQMDNQQDNYKETNDNDLKLQFLRTTREVFELEDLLAAEAEEIDSGGLGVIYKVMRLGGADVVVKRFSEMRNVGKEYFHAHMRLLGRLSHPNLLPLVAFYYTEDEKLFISDMAANGCLTSHLHGKRQMNEPGLDWPTRLKIIQGVARGLGYLYHELPQLSLPHGNLTASNVGLDEAFNPLLVDYALVPVIDKEHVQQLMVAYKSPEVTLFDRTTKKTDIWCLGILILEIMTGKSPENYLEQGKDSKLDLWTWVKSVDREEWTNKVFDKDMKWEKNNEIEMIDLLDIGIRCCEPDISRRWCQRKALEKIQGLKEMEYDEDY